MKVRNIFTFKTFCLFKTFVLMFFKTHKQSSILNVEITGTKNNYDGNIQ